MIKIFVKILVIGFWLYSVLGFYNNYKILIANSTKGIGILLCYLWLAATAPILSLNNIILSIWGLWMPDGWEIGDDDYYE